MDAKEIVKAFREHAEWAQANEWERPITLGDVLRKAADTIEEPCPFCGGEFEIITGQFAQGSAVLFHGAHMCNVLGRQISTRWCNAEKDVAEIINRRAQPSEKPLTLDELRGMVGEIVYCTPLNDWAKVTKYGLLFFGTEDYRSWREIEEGYGVKWWAYRCKPKEEV